MLTYFSIKTELTDAIDMMTDEGAGKLLKALMHYARGEKTEVNGEARLMFAVAKMTIDANASAAADKSDRARAAVTARWHKEEEQPEKKPEQKPKRTVQRFQPPTVQEVAAYCAERKNSVNAQQFVDFYAAKGWKVGTTAMKDWKACVRTWQQRESERQKPTKTKVLNEAQYTQREYSENTDLPDWMVERLEAQANGGKA